MLKNRSVWIGLLAAFVAAVPVMAVAATATWNVDGNGNWTDPDNWNPNSPPNGAGQIAYLTFNITAPTTITLDANQIIGGLEIGDPSGSPSAYTLTGGNTLTTSGAATFLKTLAAGGAAHDVIDVPITLGGNLTIDQKGRGGVLEFSQSIGNDGTNRTVTIFGNGSQTSNFALVIFSAANSYGGNTILQSGGTDISNGGGGILRVTHGQALGGGSLRIETGANATRIELAGGITIGNSVTTFNGRQEGRMFDPAIANFSGNNVWAGHISGISSGGEYYPIHSLGTAPGDFFTVSGEIRQSHNSVRNLRLGGAGDGEVTGRVYETGGADSVWNLFKDHAGTWTLSNGNNTYQGTTTVNEGKLLVNGTHTGGSAYSVTANGTLGGTGHIIPASNDGVTVLGKLSPGASVGELEFTFAGTGGLDLSAVAAGSLEFELDTVAASDKVVINAGDLNIGTLDFEDFAFTALGGFGPGEYLLFETAGTITGGLGNDGGLIDGLDATLSIVSGEGIKLTVVPEPKALLLVLMGIIGLGWTVRGKKK